MIDPNDDERAALERASQAAGEYLESLGQTDLAQFSREQWLTLIEVTVTAYDDEMRDRRGERVPF